jgi:hypothetical protein
MNQRSFDFFIFYFWKPELLLKKNEIKNYIILILIFN